MATLLAAAADAHGPFNVGRGEETTVLELARKLDLEVEHLPERAGEVRQSCLDSDRTARDLGWRPLVNLAEGLKRMLAWTPCSPGKL